MKLLKELCETPGISGREQPIIDLMKRELKKTCDSVSIDGIGNVIGVLKGKKQKKTVSVMIAGHMDEIGFVVSHIDKDGYIRIAPRGGHIPKVILSQRVRIYGKKMIIGVVEAAPAFLDRENAKTVSEIKDMFIDTGRSKKELDKLIDLGDPIVLDRDYVDQGDCIMSKAFDDRVGCYVVLEVMKQLKKKNKKLNVDIYAVGTTQEEVGIRGAIGSAKDIKPDIGIAIDVTAAFDTPGVAEHQQVTKLGEGVAIKINDQATISNHGIVKMMKKIAKRCKIKHQMEILPFGGTDAKGMQMFGDGPVCTLSVPARYIHSPNEIMNKNDVKSTIDLLVEFLQECADCKMEF